MPYCVVKQNGTKFEKAISLKDMVKLKRMKDRKQFSPLYRFPSIFAKSKKVKKSIAICGRLMQKRCFFPMPFNTTKRWQKSLTKLIIARLTHGACSRFIYSLPWWICVHVWLNRKKTLPFRAIMSSGSDSISFRLIQKLFHKL